MGKDNKELRKLRTLADKAGLPPGTLAYVGEAEHSKVKVTYFDYDEKKYIEEVPGKIDACFPLKNKPTVTWVNFDGINDIELIKKLGACYGFHNLVLEDIIDTNQRPRMEDYGDYIFVIIKMLSWKEPEQKIVSEHVSLILGSNYVVSLQETPGDDVFDPVRDRIRNKRGLIRSKKADYLLTSMLDVITDNYFFILEKIAEKTEHIEEMIIKNPSTSLLQEIHSLRRELIFLRRAAWPMREVLNRLDSRKSSLIATDTELYVKDVYHNLVQVIDTCETLRDLLSSLLDIFYSNMSNKMNEIMKVLTIITTFFMPLSFLASLYGMNFKHMPELDMVFGYPMVLGLMLAVALFMFYYFRRKKWL
jgi:magnesium transporter